MTVSYKDSGVDIDAGNELVQKIKPLVKKTFTKGVLGNIGGFAGGFKLPNGYKNPVLFSSTDGVGTKLAIAIAAKKFDTIGIDLVAMCVNDLICNFAKPLFFLDYYACGRLNVKEAKTIISGIVEACKQTGTALIGGETAEMPRLYRKNDFDLAGFAVGIAEEENLHKNKTIKKGDCLIALKSSGIHSNGYSLARKILFEELKMKLDDKILGKKLSNVLLEPTKLYVKDYEKNSQDLKALAHITGGGIIENLPRVLPNGFGAKIEKSAIKTPEILKIIGKKVSKKEMFRTFNMGVGMIFITDKNKADKICQNTGGYIFGEIAKDLKGVKIC